MSSSKVLLLTLAAAMTSNSVFCMEEEKQKTKATYPADLHPKALRRIFEKGNTDFLHKETTKNKLRQDPDYYNEVLAKQRKTLAKKRKEALRIALKKSTWGSVETLSGAAFGFGSYIFYTACAHFVRENKPEALLAFVMGTTLAIPSGRFLWFGSKKLWNNYAKARVEQRFDRHNKADQASEEYFANVFNIKEEEEK